MNVAVKEGIVKFYKMEKGFGFLTTENGPDVFFHASDIRAAGLPEPIGVGTKVHFTLAYGRDGRPKATNIALAGD